MVSHRSGHASICYPSIPLSVGVKHGVRFPVSAQMVTMAFSKADRCERNTKELSITYGVSCIVYVCSTHVQLCSMGVLPRHAAFMETIRYVVQALTLSGHNGQKGFNLVIRCMIWIRRNARSDGESLRMR